MTESRGVRAIPPALLLAFAGWVGMSIARMIFLLTAKEPWGAIRFNLTSEGIGFMCEVLAIVGMFELARRLTGRLALGMRVAAFGFVAMLAVDVGYALVTFMEHAYEHEWIFKVTSYGYWFAGLAMPIGLAVALWHERRGLAIVIVVASVLLYPPELIGKHLYSWMPSGKAGFALDSVFRLIRLGMLFTGLWFVARGVAVRNRAVAAAGMRSAARSMYLRLIAALAVPLLTVIAIGGSGGRGALDILKLAMFSALIINIIALTQFGVGALRSAGAHVSDLGRWNLAVGGAAAVWGAGVMLAQLSWLYKMLYGSSSSLFGGDGAKYAQALAVALPLVVTASGALLAIAISGFAARIGKDELRGHAQSKGAGFVTLSLVGLAITNWMLTEAKSQSGAIMLMLLAAGSMLVALVMLARLCNLAADELESDPGLPPATVVTTDAT